MDAPAVLHTSPLTHLVERVYQITQILLHIIAALIPSPVSEQVIIDVSLIYEYVLGKLDRIIVKQASQCINNLRDSPREIGLLFREILRESD